MDLFYIDLFNGMGYSLNAGVLNAADYGVPQNRRRAVIIGKRDGEAPALPIKLEHNKRLRGQPGIESITKQYLYQLAYQPFAEAHQINTVRNCFLMPTDSAEVVEKGTVSLSMLSNLGLQDIQVRLLPAETVYRHYLENTKMDIRILNL